jgi:hypothetical protein
MLNMNKLVLIPGLWLALALSCEAAEFYVAPGGDDGASGTLAAPWRTIARAQQAVQPGDTVYLRGGRYAYAAGESACASRAAIVNGVTLDRSGSEGKPIRYRAYAGETPVFDFSAMRDDCRVKGFNVTANWLHLKDWKSPARRNSRKTGSIMSHGAYGSMAAITCSSSSTCTTTWGRACSSRTAPTTLC